MPESFYKLPQGLTARRDLTAADKIVWAVLRNQIDLNGNGVAWVGCRRLARACGINPGTVLEAIPRLEAEGLLLVERRASGQTNLYRLGDESAWKTHALKKAKRSEKPSALKSKSHGKTEPSARKTHAQALGKPVHNKTDLKEEEKEGKKSAASPPAVSDKNFSLTPQDNGAVGRLVGLWIEGFQNQTGKPFAKCARGRLAGTIKNLLDGFAADELSAAIGRWFGQDRKTYSVGLFKTKIEDADADLTGRTVQKTANRPTANGKTEMDRKLMESI
ncbi:MAG: hypothetical protein SVV80_10680 [Planctomycetota bacterium]|nr:hypothetical protein [Planctomycetota bacterium]